MKPLQDLFLDIISRKEPGTIIYEDDKVIAFLDKFPVSEGHFLVVPKKHSFNVYDIENNDYIYTILKARELALERVPEELGFRLVINSGENAMQKVFHTHVHIIPGKI